MSLRTLIAATERFYAWELRGRGWETHAHPVRLEPSFVPFRRLTEARGGIVDDARRPTAFSRLATRLLARPVVSADGLDEQPEASSPPVDLSICQYSSFDVLISAGEKVPTGTSEAVLRACAAAEHPIAYELIGSAGRVTVRMCADIADADALRSQLRAFLPGATIRESEDDLADLFYEAQGMAYGALEFGLAREFMLPLRDVPQVPDPILATLGAVSGTGKNTLSLLQVLLTPARSPWREEIYRAVTTPTGDPFFLDAPELTASAEGKIETPLFAVAVRALALGKDEEEVGGVISRIGAALSQYGDPDQNALVPLASERGVDLVVDILARATYRTGMLLSLPELASIVRFPGEHVRNDALVRSITPETTLPKEVLGDGVVIGDADHRREPTPARLSTEARLQHTHVIGGSGTGKSTLLVSMILEDITSGHGVGVVDPHGDLVDEVLGRLPRARYEDVILFDPSDPHWTVGWNILGAHSDVEKELLSSDLVAVFKRLSTSWGDQMSAVLGNAVHAFLESRRGGTLAELRKFLLDETFRTAFLGTVEDDHVVSFWKEEFPLLAAKKPQAPILTRLDTFLRSRLVRTAVTEREKPLDFRKIVDSGKIFLAKLSQGAIGEENAALLGSLIVSKFHQTALSRQDVARSDRRPFFLFLDEFHEFATPSMASLFSGVRKYNLGLCVAHQDLYQLHANAPEVERAVLTNAYTRIVFRTADEDARKLERGFGDFSREDFLELERGEAIVRVGRRENSFKMKTRSLPAFDPNVAESNRQALRDLSMEAYGRPRASTVRPTNTRPTEEKVRPAPPISQPEAGEPHVESRPTPGRGGAMHKYLQSFIRETGHARGFRAEIEKEIPSGQRVDVLLSAQDVTIACEVGGTTTLEQELSNLRKCLISGFTYVCSVSLDSTLLGKLTTEISSWPADEQERVNTFSPEEFGVWLGGISVQSAEKRVAGYSVRVTHSAEGAGVDERKRAVADVLMKSVRKLKEKP